MTNKQPRSIPHRRAKVATAFAMATVLGLSAGSAAYATGTTDPSGDTDVPITGEALDQATTAALAHVGEGTVTETEVGDEDSYYEVEVRLDDGTELDVQLDEEFNVVSADVDTDEPGDTD